MTQRDLIQRLPKAELHLHIEGSFEPELMMQLAARNRIDLRFKTLDEAKAAYKLFEPSGIPRPLLRRQCRCCAPRKTSTT